MPDGETLKQRIRNGEIVTGVSVTLDTDRSRLEDILSQDAYDYVYIDGQHTAFSENRLVAFCAIAEELGIPVQLRIKHTRHAYLIGNTLDLGPSAIVVPEVQEESTVDEALSAFYYPQTGNRSWGGDARVGIQKRDDRLAYAEWWNNTGVLCLQMESIEAITHAKKLAKPGVDFLSFGPNDLTFSLEAHPEHPFKTVDECIRHVVKQLEGSDVRVGVGASLDGEREKYIEIGVTVFSEPPRS